MSTVSTLKKHPIKLRDLYISDVEAHRMVDSLPTKAPALAIDTDVSHALLNDSTVICALTVSVSAPEVLEVRVTVKGVFGVSTKNVSDDTTQRLALFADTQGMPLLWPYAREVISSQFQRLGFPPILLPLISVQDTVKALRRKGAQSKEQEAGN